MALSALGLIATYFFTLTGNSAWRCIAVRRRILICLADYGWSRTEGHAEGWHLALDRLRQEAAAAGANAVVDVKLRTVTLPVTGDSMDYTVVGTAVKLDGLPPRPDPVIATVPAIAFVRLLEAGVVHAAGHPGFKGAKGHPFTSDLSGQDFWTLRQAGDRTLELVMGSCVYHVACRGGCSRLWDRSAGISAARRTRSDAPAPRWRGCATGRTPWGACWRRAC